MFAVGTIHEFEGGPDTLIRQQTEKWSLFHIDRKRGLERAIENRVTGAVVELRGTTVSLSDNLGLCRRRI